MDQQNQEAELGKIPRGIEGEKPFYGVFVFKPIGKKRASIDTSRHDNNTDFKIQL